MSNLVASEVFDLTDTSEDVTDAELTIAIAIGGLVQGLACRLALLDDPIFGIAEGLARLRGGVAGPLFGLTGTSENVAEADLAIAVTVRRVVEGFARRIDLVACPVPGESGLLGDEVFGLTSTDADVVDAELAVFVTVEEALGTLPASVE